MTGSAAASVLSGLGFGLVAWLGFGLGAHSALFAWLSAPVALALAVAGLVASGGIPGPEDLRRALDRAEPDWGARSRALAAAALAVFAVYALPWLLFGVRIGLVGFAATLAAGASVFAAGARLREGPLRDTPLTPATLLLFALASGALGDAMLTDVTARDDGGRADGAAIFLLAAAFAVKWAWWERAKKIAGGADDAQARSARRAAVALGLIVPVVCIDLSGRFGAFFVPVGLAAHVAGLMIERRQFFAPDPPVPAKAESDGEA